MIWGETVLSRSPKASVLNRDPDPFLEFAPGAGDLPQLVRRGKRRPDSCYLVQSEYEQPFADSGS
jgi:hypothetical protein